MTIQGNDLSPPTKSDPKRPGPLFYWPITLIALTAGLFLLTNTVSAWSDRDSDRIDEIKHHAERFSRRTLDRIGASEEQQSEVQEIVRQSIDELALLHADREGFRETLAPLITAEQVDREAIEAMRVRHLSRADEMSRIVSTAIADVMEILTPEQRSALEERMSQHDGHRGHGRHFRGLFRDDH